MSRAAPDATGSAAEQMPVRLNGIQYLRAVAAITVVIFHCAQYARIDLLPLSAFGVPMFFVISGFIMVVITDDRSPPLPFLIRRVLRVAPLYWLATAATLLVHPYDYHGGRHLAASLLFVPHPYPGAGPQLMPPLNVGWTLNLELLFYAMFAVVLPLPVRYRPWALTAIIAFLVVAASLAAPSAQRLKFWGDPIILLFAAGAWLGHGWRANWAVPGWPVLALTGVVAGLSVAPAFGIENGIGFGAMWLTLAAVLRLERNGRFRRPVPPLRLLGDASYALYLTHSIVLLILFVKLDVPLATAPKVLLALTVALSVGIAVHLIVERPLLRAAHALVPSRRIGPGRSAPA